MIALALIVTGCGRKGALDPPPGGYVLDKGINRTSVSSRGEARPAPEKPPEFDEEGRPVAPSGPTRRLPGDWLIE